MPARRLAGAPGGVPGGAAGAGAHQVQDGGALGRHRLRGGRRRGGSVGRGTGGGRSQLGALSGLGRESAARVERAAVNSSRSASVLQAQYGFAVESPTRFQGGAPAGAGAGSACRSSARPHSHAPHSHSFLCLQPGLPHTAHATGWLLHKGATYVPPPAATATPPGLYLLASRTRASTAPAPAAAS